MVYSNAILIDTSAVVALIDKREKFHNEAIEFFNSNLNNFLWVVTNPTTYETYTRVRYNLNYNYAVCAYNFLRNKSFYQIDLNKDQEIGVITLLSKFSDHKLSFHDAICATLMKNYNIYRTFSFDHHFFIFGFEVLPGVTK